MKDQLEALVGQMVERGIQFDEAVNEFEKKFIKRILDRSRGNQSRAARLLGIGERTLYRVMQDWKLQDKIRASLKEAEGDLAKAAALMGIKPEVLGRKMKKLGLEGLAGGK